MKIIKLAAATLGIIGLLILMPISSHKANAALCDAGASGGSNISKCLDAGACAGTDSNSCTPKHETESKISEAVRLVLNILSVAVGVIAIIMIIIAGLKYVISGGESSNIASAKNTIIYAIVGLVIVVFAQVIVKFVLHKVAS